jgi:Domain of unknown function (DUF4157)
VKRCAGKMRRILCRNPGGTAVFAPKVAKPRTKPPERFTLRPAPRHSALTAPPYSRGTIASPAPQRAKNHLSWDFSRIPLFPPDRTNRPLPIQPKLAIGRVNDPLENEADQFADQVLRMPHPMRPVAAVPPQVSRKCAACDEEEKEMLQTKRTDAPASGPAAPKEAPQSVHAVLGSSGQRLDTATRAFFEPRFGHDFTRVRVHADARAAVSAAEIGARAYAVGEDIVFGAGEYAPSTPEGRSLLAHELVHVMQQGSARDHLRRAPCRSAAQCATPASGDPGQFSGVATAAEATKAAVLNAAPLGSPEAALKARTGERAIHIENLLSKNAIGIRPEVVGFFVNPNIDANVVGAQTDLCRFFPGGSPGTPPAAPDKRCVQVPAEMEDTAKGLDIATPLSAAQRDTLATDVLGPAVHEMQHATFDTAQDAPATKMAAASDCSLDTIITPPDINVEFLLSEISAITSEFPVFFENTAKSPHAVQNLDSEERRQAFDPGEGLVGSIKSLQCGCSCATVESFVTQTVKLTTASWAPATELAFFKAMTGWMPSFWPKALQRK